jgi:hypothetical protein
MIGQYLLLKYLITAHALLLTANCRNNDVTLCRKPETELLSTFVRRESGQALIVINIKT